jgi:hypothetical protein
MNGIEFEEYLQATYLLAPPVGIRGTCPLFSFSLRPPRLCGETPGGCPNSLAIGSVQIVMACFRLPLVPVGPHKL